MLGAVQVYARSYPLLPFLEPMFQSATTTNNPFFQTLENDVSNEIFRARDASTSSHSALQEGAHVGKIEGFFEISKHTSGSPLTSTFRGRNLFSYAISNFREYSPARNIFFER